MKAFSRDDRGGTTLGVLIGFILMIVLGSFPIFGPLVAGFAAGALTKQGTGKGALMGFLSGIMGAIIVAILMGVAGGLLGFSVGMIGLGSMMSLTSGMIMILLSLNSAIFGLIGGLIGVAVAGE